MAALLRTSLVVALLFALTGCAAAPQPSEAREWEQAFQRSSGFGWSGGDAVTSIPLPGGRLLWLFGDSYLSEVENGERQKVQFRFGNTIALQNGYRAGAAPVAGDLAFDWGSPTSNGWMPLPYGILADVGAPASAQKALQQRLTLLSWPLHGAVVGTDLLLFDIAVTPFDCSACEPFNFKPHGTVASIVRGVDRPYAKWGFRSGIGWEAGREPTQKFVPWSRASDALTDMQGTLWGTFVMKDAADPSTLYVYGGRTESERTALVLARVTGVQRADDVLVFDRWRFWNGAEFVRDSDAAMSIAENSAIEASVVPVPESRGGGYALVRSTSLWEGQVVVSLATHPWGPFEDRYTFHLADCPVRGYDAAADQLTYAAKAHPELGTEDELLISLVTSKVARESPLITDAHQYAPRFVRLPWDEVFTYERTSADRCAG